MLKMKFPTRIYYTETDKALMWDRTHHPKICKLVENPVLGRVVAKKLKQFWSPEQIAGWLKYTYIDGREMPELTRLSVELFERRSVAPPRGADHGAKI
jgi:IS30 family transposase